jgi:hypothetical protein
MLKSRVQNILNSSSVLRDFFPPDGGGNLRRWWRLQKDLFQKFRDEEHPLKGPVTLFDFRDPHDAADAKSPSPDSVHGWRYSDDSVIGGFSRAALNFIQSKADLESVEKGESPRNGNVDPDFLPFIRWKGTIDTRVGEKAPKRVAKSGFCSIKSPVYPFSGAVLSKKYNSLELTLRTDGRQYWVNLYPDSTIPEDLFQVALTLPPLEPSTDDPTEEVPFRRVFLPFPMFLNTCNGRLREMSRRLDNGVDIKSIGFTLMDGLEGDFEFDLASIRAVNFHEGCILGEEDEGAPY